MPPSDPRLVLAVDDEPTVREVLAMRMEVWGYRVVVAADGAEARRVVRDSDPDIVLSDVVLPDISGLELLDDLAAEGRSRPVILMTAYGTVEAAVRAMKAGAKDFLTKPLDYGKLEVLLEEAVREVRLRDRTRELDDRLDRCPGLGEMIGESQAMSELFRVVRRVAGTDAPALISGASGTGKELVARTIHEMSARGDGPLVAINAAAIPGGLMEGELFGHEKGAFTGADRARRGRFEEADGGTLFLDEIAEMPVELQPKLLRVLEDGRVRRLGSREEREVDVRVRAATNRDPQEAVDRGDLRGDLFYRLGVFQIRVPDLAEREGDVPLLAQHYVHAFNEKHGFEVEGARDEALEQLEGYAWPGNVRELRNVVERAVVMTERGWIEVPDLPPYLHGKETGESPSVVEVPVGTTAAEAEKRLILATLEEVGNNKAEAARRLDLDVKTIRNKLKAYGLF